MKGSMWRVEIKIYVTLNMVFNLNCFKNQIFWLLTGSAFYWLQYYKERKKIKIDSEFL